MKLLLRFAPLLLFVLAAPSVALAQRTFVTSVGFANGVTTIKIAAPDSCESLSIIMNAPVSYQRFQDSIQVLADGTRLTHTSMVDTLYRDSAGRVHLENPVFIGRSSDRKPRQMQLIKIQDPTVGFQYILDTTNHVAYRFPFASCDDGSQGNAKNSPAPRTAAQSKTVSTSSDPDRIQHSSKSLGTQVIEGIQAKGFQSTTVFPVGLFGNDRPITRTCESWEPEVDLGTPVLYKCSDPRFGDSTTRMTNIILTEPDPTLFQVPPGYSIADGQGDITLKLHSAQP